MIPQFSFPSLHMCGTRDQYNERLLCHTLFTEESKPKLIEFDEGHKFPRAISESDYELLKDFVRDQFLTKNSDENGFDVDTPSYNFDVRFDKK